MGVKAVALMSGGLDSTLAAKIIKLQGIDVIGLAFVTSFTHPKVDEVAQQANLKIRLVDISSEYRELIKNPRFGFGKNMNPCVDCHIFFLKKAKQLMLEENINFVITGEVLGQRPMSQHMAALRKVEAESELQGLLLRPLSAKLLPETIPEKEGWVDRNKLFSITGRSRKAQIELARQLGLENFPQPAGGCLLTDPGFSKRLKDLICRKKEFSLRDIELLKLGRHFRLSTQDKLIVGRDHKENQRLIELSHDYAATLFPEDVPGPTGVLDAKSAISADLLELSAKIIARYCDSDELVNITIKGNDEDKVISCTALEKEKVEELRIK